MNLFLTIYFIASISPTHFKQASLSTFDKLAYLLYFSYVLSFIPKINLTNPLKNFGTFLTTIVIINFLLLRIIYPHSHISPTATITTPIINSQPDIGSNKTNSIPNPKPIKHTAKVFFNAHNIFITSLPFVYYIIFILHLLPFYGYFVTNACMTTFWVVYYQSY